MVHAELPQNVSWAGPSANAPPAIDPISWSVPPVPEDDPPTRIWYRGPLYLLYRSRTVLYAATHGVPLET
jgi:hypothetical protein